MGERIVIPSRQAPAAGNDGDRDGDDGALAAAAPDPSPAPDPAPVQQAPAPQATPSPQPNASPAPPMSSPANIVLSRESGGNYRAVNASSGADGAYQFLPSTWHALGYSGLPQDASPATQDQAFARAYAQWGTQPWSPSDHC